MDDYYDILGVSRTASEEEITTAISNVFRSEQVRKNSPRKEVRREAERRIELIDAA